MTVHAVGVLWYNGSKSEDIGGSGFFAKTGFACTKRTPPQEYRGGASNVVWAAVHNQFFALALMPPTPGQAIVIEHLDLPRPTGEEAKLVATNAPPPSGYQASLVYPPVTLTANQPLERRLFIYAGPKEYRTVASIADTFNNNLDQIMSFGSWYGFVSKALLLGMNWLHDTLRVTYGWAIVVITLFIKLVFWPFTAASTRSSKRMQSLQPQVAAIRDKYKDDPMKTHQKTMELYKKNKVNPMGSCIPMVVQIPVFFGFLAMLRSAIELRGAPWLWAGDLTKPDTLFVIPALGVIPLWVSRVLDCRLTCCRCSWAPPCSGRRAYPAVPGHGSFAAGHHEIPAADLPGGSLQLFVRLDALLDGQQYPDHHSDQADEEHSADHGRAGRPRSSLDPAAEKEEISENQFNSGKT